MSGNDNNRKRTQELAQATSPRMFDKNKNYKNFTKEIQNKLEILETQNDYLSLSKFLLSLPSNSYFLEIDHQTDQFKLLIELIKVANRTIVQIFDQKNEFPHKVLLLVQAFLENFEAQTEDEKKVKQELTICHYNNFFSYFIKAKKNEKALPYLLKALKLSEKTDSLFLKGLTFNNLCSYHLMQKNYSESYKYGEIALKSLENLVFGQINKESEIKRLKSNSDFIKNLTLLIAGYLNFARTLDLLIASQESMESIITNKSPNSFLMNGLKLSKKYLSEEHPLTLKIKSKLNKNNDNNIREDSQGKNVSNYLIKSTTSEDRHNASKTSSRSNSRYNLFNDKNEKAYLRNENEPMAKKLIVMYELDKTLSDMRRIKAHYERENDIINNQNEMMKMNMNMNMRRMQPNYNNFPIIPNNNFINYQPELNNNIDNNMNPFNNIFDNNMNHFKSVNLEEKASHNKKNVAECRYCNTELKKNPPEKNIQLERKEEAKSFEESIEEKFLQREKEYKEREKERIKELEKLSQRQLEMEQLLKDLKKENEAVLKNQELKDKELENLKATIDTLKAKANSNQNSINQAVSNPPIIKKSSLKNEKNIQTSLKEIVSDRVEEKGVNNQKTNEEAVIAIISPQRLPKIQNFVSSKHVPKDQNEELKDNMNSTRLNEENRSSSDTSINNFQRNQIVNKNDNFHENSDEINIICSVFKDSLSNYQPGAILKKKMSWNSMEYCLGVEIKDLDKEISVCLSGYNQTHDRKLPDELISLDRFLKMIRNLDINDVLDYDCPLHSAKDYREVIENYILPFIGISESFDFDSERIELWAKAHGIFSNLMNYQFYDEEFFVFVNYIKKNVVRIVLLNKTSSKNFRFDIKYDDISFEKFFKVFPGKPGGQKENIEKCLHIMKSEKKTNEVNNNEAKEIHFESRQIVNSEEYEKHLKGLISDLEEFLKNKGYQNLKTLFEDKMKYLKIKVFGTKVKSERKEIPEVALKSRICFIAEIIEKNGFEIFLKNMWETYGPKGSKVKAEGSTLFDFENIWKKFGVYYGNMDLNDKHLIASLILDTYDLEVFDKKIDEEDEGNYDQNRISIIPIENHSFYRAYIGTTYKIPITICLIIAKDIPLGIKFTIYNTKSCTEIGKFFSLKPELWKSKEIADKKKTKYLKVYPLESNYDIVFFLKQMGYKFIFESCDIERNDLFSNNIVSKMNRKLCSCENFERLVDVEKVRKSLEGKN